MNYIRYCNVFLMLMLMVGLTSFAQQETGNTSDSTKRLSDKDIIPLPFGYNTQQNTTGSSFVLKGSDLEKYPSNDLRNALVGLIPGLDVIELDGSPGMSAEESVGLYGSTTKVDIGARGFAPIWIIDNVTVDITEMPLDPQEIESITFIKDVVAKNMYGPRATGGVILVKTKRGQLNEKQFNVNVEAGSSIVDRFPEWVNGTDYAKMNNEARTNSGLTPLYDANAIAQYSKNDAYNMVYPNINFKDMMLKDTKSYKRVNLSSAGGNEYARYFAYLGYSGEGDIYKMGSAADYNRLNVRANIDLKVNDFMKVKFDFFGGLSIRKSPNYEYGSAEGSLTDINEFTSLISDITTIPAIAFPIYASVDSATGIQSYGLSSTYKTNPIANLTQCGYYSEMGRNGSSNISLDIDLSKWVPGLKSLSSVSLNNYNLVRLGKAEQYAADIVTPNSDGTGYSTQLYQNQVLASGESNMHDYYLQRYSGFQTFSYEHTFNKIHDVQTALTYNIFRLIRNQTENPYSSQNLNWYGLYTYDGKYSVQAAVNYSGTQTLPKENQYRLFPSLGASWIVSEESFMKNISCLDFLKLRAEYGVTGNEIMFASLFLYEDNWSKGTGSSFGPYTTGQWFGSKSDASPYVTTNKSVGNPNLDWETRNEFSLGIDALALKNKLSATLNYYHILRKDMLTSSYYNYPYVAGIAGIYPVINYNSVLYQGFELAMKYTDKVGELKYSVGGSLTLPSTKIVKINEPDYRYDYQSKVGDPIDAYYGLVYTGKYESDEAAAASKQTFDEKLQKGDLAYEDLNNDGFVDDFDYKMIGNSLPKMFYALNMQLAYKNFELAIVGNGRAFYDVAIANRYFQNGWGTDNYSKFVQENAGGDAPRLTYYKVNNNYKFSEYWLRNGSFFKIQNVEFAYNLPSSITKKMGNCGIKAYVRGANLMTISSLNDVDPESINSGIDRYPLFRTFTAGLKLTF